MGETGSERKFGRYTLLHLLAHGGMSEVYLACDESGTQNYALKMVYREDEEYCLRFQREVSLQSALKHPHILPILDYGEQEDVYYCVTPYIKHGTLKDRILQKPLDFYTAERVLSQVADALQFLHEAGLLHRDIKPANILLEKKTNHVWLADFGLVKEIDGASDLTSTGCLVGTPFYLAPELLERPASVSSDLYALGVVLYEMLTGTLPFTGKTPLVICLKHLHEVPPLPSTFNSLISPAIEQVILRALQKNPAARFPSASHLAEAYSQALAYTMAGEETDSINNVSLSIKVKPLPTTKRQNQARKRLLVSGFVAAATIFTLCLACLGTSYVGRTALPAGAAQMISLPRQIHSAPATSDPGHGGVNASSSTKSGQTQGDETGKHSEPKKHDPNDDSSPDLKRHNPKEKDK